MYPTTLLDARWLSKGGTGAFTRSLLEGLGGHRPAGWAVWGPPEVADLVWPGARHVSTDVDPAAGFGQRSALRVPRADLVLHPHQTRPIHRRPAASCILDLIQLDQPNVALRAAMAARLRLTIRSATVLFTIADDVRDEMGRRYGIDSEAVTVLRLPVDEAAAARVRALRAGHRPDRQLVAVGRFAPHKNQRSLVEAFGRTAFAAGGGRLVLVGGTPDELGVAPGDLPAGVTIAGAAPQPELEAIVARSLVLVQPSLREGLGLPVLEALAAGVPVVSSPIPAVTELGPAGLPTFDPTSVDSMARVIDATVDAVEAGRYWTAVDRDAWLRTRPTPATLAEQVLTRLEGVGRPRGAS